MAMTHLGQDTRSEERQEGNNGNDAHIANPVLHTFLHAPERDSEHADEQDKVVCL